MNSIKVKDLAKKERNSFTDGDWIEAPFLVESGIRLIQTGNIGIGEFKGKNKKYISEESFKKLNCKEIFPEDILICRLAEPIGRAIKIPKLNDRLITSVDVTILRVSDKFDKDFILQKINSEEILATFLEKSGGSTRQRISRKNLGEVELELPEKPFQTKIAKILNTVDNVISSTEEAITKYQDIKKGMMRDLFSRGIDLNTGQLRPNYKDAPNLYKESKWGIIPNEWEVEKVDEIVTKYLDFRGKTPLKLGMNWGNGEIMALSANNVEMGKINFDKECYLASEKLYKKWMNKGDCKKGDIILTMEAPLGNIAQIPDNRKYILSQRTILIKLDLKKVHKDYIFYLLSGVKFQASLFKNSTGSTVTGIQQKKLAKINIAYPLSQDEQEEISKRLISVDKLIVAEQENLSKHQNIKKGLMQDLLTGKVEVKI